MPSRAARRAAPQPPIYITEADNHRLSSLVGGSAAVSPGATLLRTELERAVVVGPGELPRRFAKLNSTVRYEDRASGKTRTVQLVLPDAADIDENRISVFTPVGAALLGLKVGQEFTWGGDAGRTRVLRVLDVEDGHEAS